MLQIDDKLISLDVLEKKFVCQTDQCHGACCVSGDSGAPLEAEEADILYKEYPKIAPFLREEGRKSIEKQGTHIIDTDREMVTPLVEGRECAYVVFVNNVALCGIEKAFLAGKTIFRKPLSCHLYPIRLKKYPSFLALNYDRWDVCKPAREAGEDLDVPVFVFLRDAIIRKFGLDFYQELEVAREHIQDGKPI